MTLYQKYDHLYACKHLVLDHKTKLKNINSPCDLLMSPTCLRNWKNDNKRSWNFPFFTFSSKYYTLSSGIQLAVPTHSKVCVWKPFVRVKTIQTTFQCLGKIQEKFDVKSGKKKEYERRYLKFDIQSESYRLFWYKCL